MYPPKWEGERENKSRYKGVDHIPRSGGSLGRPLPMGSPLSPKTRFLTLERDLGPGIVNWIDGDTKSSADGIVAEIPNRKNKGILKYFFRRRCVSVGDEAWEGQGE